MTHNHATSWRLGGSPIWRSWSMKRDDVAFRWRPGDAVCYGTYNGEVDPPTPLPPTVLLGWDYDSAGEPWNPCHNTGGPDAFAYTAAASGRDVGYDPYSLVLTLDKATAEAVEYVSANGRCRVLVERRPVSPHGRAWRYWTVLATWPDGGTEEINLLAQTAKAAREKAVYALQNGIDYKLGGRTTEVIGPRTGLDL